MSKKPLARRILRRLVLLALAGFVALAVLLWLLWLERRTEISLPMPTGPFAVGRAVYDWVDEETVDALAPRPGTRRELLVWFWYPAEASGAGMDDYVPAALREPAKRAGPPLPLWLLTRDLSKVHGHSLSDPALSEEQRSYPVVLMRGGASSEVLNYSTLAEDLASHGYVVVAFDAPYRTRVVVFPDGRVVERMPENNPELVSGEALTRRADKLLAAWTADCAYVLDRLERLKATDPAGKFVGRLDLTRVGIFGHSFGGATAAQFCAQDARCKVGIDIDGSLHGTVLQSGIHKPFLFLLSDHGDGTADAETRRIMADIQSVYDRLPPGDRLRVTIRGANHFTFSDDGALLKSRLARGVLRLLGQLRIDGSRQLAVTAYCVHCFFDAYLKGAGPRPRLSTSLYPEIETVE
jgi:predicted dienelactone hydrolase